MRRLAIVLVLLAALIVPLPAATPGENWALVVGVDQYDSSELAPLRYARADARSVAYALINACGYKSDRVVLISGGGSDQERPTSTNILRWLQGFEKSVKSNDSFVFFFSGHGIMDGEEGMLLCQDSSIGSPSLLRKSSLGVSEIRDELKRMKVGRILQVFDACRNDPRTSRGGGADQRLSGQAARETLLSGFDLTATLFACRAGQRSYEGMDGHGYFSYFLVKGLYGEAANSEGAVTLASLARYLERQVPQAVALHEQGKTQQPWAEINGTGAVEWVFNRTGAGSVPATMPSPAAGATVLALSLPERGTRVSDAEIPLEARINGDEPAVVMLAVNGQPVEVPRSARSGRLLRLRVPLEMGENAVMVATIGSDGVPHQSVAVVTRDASAPTLASTSGTSPSGTAGAGTVASGTAGSAGTVVAGGTTVVAVEWGARVDGRITAAVPVVRPFTGPLHRKRTEWDRNAERYGSQGADLLTPTGGDRSER